MYRWQFSGGARPASNGARPGSWLPLRSGALCGVLMLAACAGVPSQQMSDARLALDAARQAHAQQHAPAALERANSALEGAARALRSGEYGDARRLAERARDEAIVARELAVRVAQVSAAIDAARAAGRPWQGAENLLREARSVSKAGDTARAVRIATRAMDLVR